MSEARSPVLSRRSSGGPRSWLGESRAGTAGPVGGRRSGSTKPEPWWAPGKADPGGCEPRRDAGVASDSRQRASAIRAKRVALGRQRPCGRRAGHRSSRLGQSSIAAGRSSTNCSVAQGSAGQKRSPGTPPGTGARKAGLPLSSMREWVRGGQRCESAAPGNGRFQRVLVTTSRLQRLVRGIFPHGPAARQRRVQLQGDSRIGNAHHLDQAGISALRTWCSDRSGRTNLVAEAV